MINHIEVQIECPFASREFLMYEFEKYPETAIQESEKGFSVYFPEDFFNNEKLSDELLILQRKFTDIKIHTSKLLHKNWNKKWESNYQPKIIANKYYIKAPFHDENPDLINFTIMPDMAFGTGHHATTEIIFTLLEEKDVENMKLLDFGCGTGILSILAAYKKATSILAIDIEKEAVDICRKNAEINHFPEIQVKQASIENIDEHHFDIIIANINRNVLLRSAKMISQKLKSQGTLFLSGFFKEDLELIAEEYEKYNIFIKKKLEKENWLGLACEKRT
jgi:ribosomal protein L11 methyltransferase